MQANQSQPKAARETVLHTPGPWATDIELAAETIQREGAYDKGALKRALQDIADGHKRPQAIAKKALDAEHEDSRIDGAVIYANGGDQICSFPHDPEDGLVLDAQTIANARLMAAAPELLEALEFAAEYFESPPFVALHGITPFDKARRVIRKARGI